MIQMKGHVVPDAIPDNPILRYLKGHVPFERTALFRAFRAAVGTYVEIPTLTLSGDYDIEVDALFTGEILALYGRTDNFNVRGRVNADGSVECRPVNNSATVASGPGVVPLSQLSKIVFRRQGVGFEIVVNGSAVVSGGTSTDDASFDAIARSSSLYANNIIAQFKVTAAEANRLYRDFSRADGIVPNEFADLGEELASAVTTDSGSSFNGGVLTLVQDAGNEFAQTDGEVVAGTTHILSYHIDDSADLLGTLCYADASSLNFIELPKNEGWHSIPINPVFNGPLRLIIRNNAGQIVISKLSLKSADGYAQLYNGADDSVKRYAKKGQVWVNAEWPNLFIQSESFSNPAWVRTRGDITQEGAVEQLTSNDPAETYIYQSVAANDENAVLTARIKKGSTGWAHLLAWDGSGSGARAWFNVDTGTAGTHSAFGSGWSVINHFVSDAGDGWYDCIAIFQKVGSVAIGRISPSDGNGSTGSAIGKSVYIARAQIGEGATLQNYKKTKDVAGHQIPIAQEAIS